MARRTKIIEKDMGWKAIKKAMMEKPTYVDVGLLENADPRDSEMDNVAIGTVHEFGSSKANIPERSFIRSTVDEKERTYKKLLSKVAGDVIDHKSDGPLKPGLNAVGSKVKSDIRSKIRGQIPPPNAPSTISKKGSSTPLIDSGQLVQALDHEVHQ